MGGSAADASSWIEIPTHSVEQWVEKGESSKIQRTAKVTFPTNWGDEGGNTHNSPRQLVSQYGSGEDEEFGFARISFEREDGSWVYTHFGWIGGVGQASEVGVSKMWVYDVSELLSGVPISHTFNNPTTEQALRALADITNENTPIPISGVVVNGETAAMETEQRAEDFDTATQNDGLGGIPSIVSDLFNDALGQGTDYGAIEPFTSDRIAAALVQRGAYDPSGLGSKTFRSNHDTLLDLYEWFETRTNSVLRFEIAQDGESVHLDADIEPTRRTFAQTEVISEIFSESIGRFGVSEYTFHDPVTVLKNNALYEMKPKNTVHLRGAVGDSFLGGLAEDYGEATGLVEYETPSEKYPVAKAQIPALVDAADGTELAPEVIDSDASTLEQAEKEAKRRLRELAEEPSEGEIVLKGAPMVRPFDRVDAYEVCNDQVVYDAEPVSYEVESVKHVKNADGRYETKLRVSIWAGDEEITVDSHMEEV